MEKKQRKETKTALHAIIETAILLKNWWKAVMIKKLTSGIKSPIQIRRSNFYSLKI